MVITPTIPVWLLAAPSASEATDPAALETGPEGIGMRNLANVFLILFFADGFVSFLDECASLDFALPLLSQLREGIAQVVLLLAFAVFQAMGFDRRLPKRILLPPVLFVALFPIVAWLVPSVGDSAAFRLLGPVLQILVWPVYRLAREEGGGLLLPKSTFEGPSFSLRNTLTFGLLGLFIVPLGSLGLLLSGTDAFLRKNTAGFMRVAPDGIYMAEKVYRRDGKTIRLIGMIHLGEQRFYRQLTQVAGPARTIVLAEGVSDRKNLLPNRLDYGRVADYLGLTLQQEELHLGGKMIEAAELDRPKPRELAWRPGQVDVMRADVDVSAFRPETVRFLDELGRQMKESPSIAKVLLDSRWSEKYLTGQAKEIIMDDILRLRNKELIGNLRKAVPRYDTVVVPWGALHMPEVEAEVLGQGFTLYQVRQRVSLDFGKLLRIRTR